jgi:lipopolysaccharide export system protein LptA
VTPRTIHIGASFAIVLVAYSAYALLAVPWIEPRLTKPIDKGVVIDTTVITRNDLEVLFPPDSWQIKKAKVINSGKSMLLWETYKNHQDGWVDLTPLTVIFMPKEDENGDFKEQLRHAVVMDVPDGANLRFDRPFDINKGGIGRLIEGRLRGPVKIHSQGKKPDHSDDLLVETHDVDLTEQRITTASDVDFRLGRSFGRGRQMEITLLPRTGPRNGNQEGPNVGGIEQFQLEHVEHLHLEMASPAPSTGAGIPAKAGTPAPAAPADRPMLGMLSSRAAPVEITCRGPFRFHVVDQVATFRDQVDVLRIQPNGPSDHLSCELLSIFFTRPAPRPGAPAKQSAPGFDLEPARIEAVGTPATITAPMDQLQGRAERLQYNLKDGQICLEDTQEVVLKKEHDEIHTPNLCCTPGPPEHPRQFKMLAAGPGWLRGAMADRPDQQLEAHWHEKLEVRPQDQNQVISLLGGAALNFQGMGRLDAKDIHFWLHESPPPASGYPAAGHSALQPDRLLAEKNVVGDSPQFSTKVERLEVWFSHLAPFPARPQAAAGTMYPWSAAGSTGPYVPSTLNGPVLAQAPTGTSTPAESPLMPFATSNPAAAGGRHPEGTRHLEIIGRLLQARVLLRDRGPTVLRGEGKPSAEQQGELTEVTVVDNVRLRETQTASPSDKPLLVTGQWLHATEANSPQAKVTVKGEPAHMEGRGMSLTGPNIFIDRGGNVLKMEGPGAMEQFLDHDLENHPLKEGSTLKINWQKNMHFDGRKASFQDSVNVVSDAKLLQTGSLDVYFQQAVSFSDLKPQQPKVERIVCGGGVFIENRAITDGQPVSYDRMQLQSLDLNNISGEFHGAGPGWLVSVSRGGKQGFPLPGGPLAGMGPPRTAFGPQATQTTDPNQLACFQLRFLRSISGNSIQKDVVFHGQVRAGHAPVPLWTSTLDLESDDPGRMGPEAFVLDCDTMQVAQMSPVSGGRSGSMEVAALDNVIVQAAYYNSRSARATYAQAKDLVILEGDGRSDAELFKQEVPGGPVSRFAAQKLEYYIKTGQVKTEGVRAYDGILPQGGQGKPRGK